MEYKYTRYDKFLVLIILIYVFPHWWQVFAAIVAAAVLGAAEEFIFEIINRWKARRARIGG